MTVEYLISPKQIGMEFRTAKENLLFTERTVRVEIWRVLVC